MAPKKSSTSQSAGRAGTDADGAAGRTRSRTGTTAEKKSDSKPAKEAAQANDKPSTSKAASKAQAKRPGPEAKSKPEAKKAKKGDEPEVVETVLDTSEGKRDKNGFLTFQGFPEFKPNLTPKQVIQAHSFGGIYFNPMGGKPGIKYPEGVPIDHKEFPADWFEGLEEEFYLARRYLASRNKYGVKAGQDQAAWEEQGWIREQDPRGWFHWYCRFYMGRRTEDDKRQIGRWKGVAGLKGRWKRSLVNKILAKGTVYNDASVSPIVRQSLLHWAYELTEPHFQQMSK